MCNILNSEWVVRIGVKCCSPCEIPHLPGKREGGPAIPASECAAAEELAVVKGRRREQASVA